MISPIIARASGLRESTDFQTDPLLIALAGQPGFFSNNKPTTPRREVRDDPLAADAKLGLVIRFGWQQLHDP
jgi:hypothetical protein